MFSRLEFQAPPQVFIRPFRAANLLSKQEVSILFINWKDLIITNTKLIKSMRIRRATVQSQSIIGDILCENVRPLPMFCFRTLPIRWLFQFPAMTAYIRFCSSQLSAAALLQKLVGKTLSGFKKMMQLFTIREDQVHLT